jgi:hypothetical protein
VARRPLLERLYEKVELDLESPRVNGYHCLMWTGARSRGGDFPGHPKSEASSWYGRIFVAWVPKKNGDGKTNQNEYVHRVVGAEMLGRPLLKEEEPDHLCGNTLCIEEAHLEVVSKSENCSRARRAECEEQDDDIPF